MKVEERKGREISKHRILRARVIQRMLRKKRRKKVKKKVRKLKGMENPMKII